MNRDFIKEVGPVKWFAKTLQRQFFKRIWRRDHYMKLPSGEQFLLPISSKFASEAYTTQGNVDWGSEALLYKLLQGKGVFLDIGANIGYYSVYMTPKAGRIYSFEPDPRVYEMLKKNVKDRSNISIVSKAVGKENATGNFTLESDGEVSHLSRNADNTANEISVDIITIDSFVEENHLEVEAIKIDAEGFDFDVIIGAEHTLQSQRPIVLTEALPSVELNELVQKLNYKIFAYTKKRGEKKTQFISIEPEISQNFATKMLFLIPSEREDEALQEVEKIKTSDTRTSAAF